MTSDYLNSSSSMYNIGGALRSTAPVNQYNAFYLARGTNGAVYVTCNYASNIVMNIKISVNKDYYLYYI